MVLLREGPAGPEVLLTTRPKRLRFMGGAAVFPGGATSGADLDPRWAPLSTRTPDDAARALGLDDGAGALSAFVCALREAFEEVGLLLAEGPTDLLRREDAEDAAGFLDRCDALRVRLRTDLLVPAGRWVTPLGAPVRFDARFFVAEAPPGWVPVPDEREVERCWWTPPADALAALATGDLVMAPPTIEMLQRLDGRASVGEIKRSLAEAPVGASGSVLSVRLSPLVHVVLAPNAGLMTGPGTNTYIVGSGPTCVIDPAVDDEQYLTTLFEAAGEVSEVLVTHRHGDHVGGVGAVVDHFGCPVRAFGSSEVGGVAAVPLHDRDVVQFGGGDLLALHTPGHASDHLCFYFEAAASLFAGDNILGEGTAVIAPPDGNMRQYLDTLRRLRELSVDRIYPGHFRPLDGGRVVIDGYLAHREERRTAVLEALRSRPSTPEEVVSLVYSDTPTQLHPVARLQVLSMLELLSEQGLVAPAGERWIASDVD